MLKKFRLSRQYPLIISVVVALVVATTVIVSGKSVELKKGSPDSGDNGPKIGLAYVESGRKNIPDAGMFSHLVYAFAEFNDNCDGLVVPTPEKLRGMSELKALNPDLKVILGVGGYKREGFSEMARDSRKRKAFVRSVREILTEYNLDGVDLDWEFPTTEAGGHTATPEDDKNYVKVVRDLRKALGKKKWISFYSNNGAGFIDLKGMVPYVTYVNVSGYNLSVPAEGKRAYHQSPLYSSAATGDWCVKKSVERHIEKGVPPEKILVGIPFFGRGKTPFPSYVECKAFDKYDRKAQLKWDDEAQAPYYTDGEGNLVMGFDDARSIKSKFDFVRSNRLPGVFIWNYDSDYDDHRLGRAVQRLRK